MLNSTWLFRFLECLQPVKILNFFLLVDFYDHITPKLLELVFPKRDISIIRFIQRQKARWNIQTSHFAKTYFTDYYF